MKVEKGKVKTKELRWRQPQQQRLPMKLSELMKDAEQEAEREYPVSVSDLGGIIDSLLKKRFTWQEISEWFAARGIEYAPGSLAGGHRKWQEREKAKDEPESE